MNGRNCIAALKALSEGTRLRILKLLFKERLSVTEISDRLSASQYNVSKHLRVLKHAGIVDMRVVAQRHEYFIAKPFRKRLQKEGMTLDFGCCSFDFSKLPD